MARTKGMVNMEEKLQVIELQQLPVIVERLHNVKAEIERKTAEATSLICTEETYKTVKDARAALTKEFKALEDQRIAVKKKLLEPYDAFEQVYRECVTIPFRDADAELKRKIDEVTNGIVADKTQAVMEYYNELVEAAGIDWLADLNYRPKVNMSSSVAAVKKQVKAFVDGIVQDVEVIHDRENSAEIMVEYRRNLDLAAAIKAVDDRHRALEEQKRRDEEYRQQQAERLAAAQNAALAAAKGEPKQEVIAPAQEIEPDPEQGVREEPTEKQPAETVFKTNFWAKGTLSQLFGLKQYLERNGIEYGNL